MKRHGAPDLQGEFGIGLLSFWTVGEELQLSSPGNDGRTYQMQMRKGDPTYSIATRRVLFPDRGTELTIRGILPGVKQFSGEKIQWYLASELRDRIRTTGVQIKVIDRISRSEHKVEPRQFEGRLLHEISKDSKLYLEIYLNSHHSGNVVALYKNGTRVLENLAELPAFAKPPWTSGYLQGLVDAAQLNLTPGTRTGVIQDDTLAELISDLLPIEQRLLQIIHQQQRAEEERTSKEVLRSIQNALKEALLALPAEEYDWFDLRIRDERPRAKTNGAANSEIEEPLTLREGADLQTNGAATPDSNGDADAPAQKQFFEYAGPLFSVKISPSSSVAPVKSSKTFRAICRDRGRHLVEEDLTFKWEIVEGEGQLENQHGEIVTYIAPAIPGLTRLRVFVEQREIKCQADALITVTDSMLPQKETRESPTREGIPSYTFQKAPGELWRSRFNPDQNVVVINSGHRDFVYASRNKSLQLRYISRLFSKELVLRNFAGLPQDQVLERLIELSLYTEEHLK
jgi:hypothetical protein